MGRKKGVVFGPRISYANRRFGMLFSGPVFRRSARGQFLFEWLCVCDCGQTVWVYGPSLKSGATKSCGCFRRAKIKALKTKHGDSSYTKEYATWRTMRQRCNNPNVVGYKYWGGRGIRVCERWNKFENFRSDMGPRPSGDFSIDRINNDGNYEPSNCRWATRSEQIANQRKRKPKKEM